MIFIASTQFTRPANVTAYAAKSLIANNTAAGSVVIPTIDPKRPMDVRRLIVRKNGNSAIQLGALIVDPALVMSIGDGGLIGDQNVLPLGLFGFGTPGASLYNGAQGAVAQLAPVDGIDLPVRVSGRFGILLVADTAYAPGNAEVFTIQAECTVC